ncbi:DUF4440 domain-containing protein [Balneola sp. MJW-20]|uniref:DUF4440 domain-containing protein n=1 Tax=Gracilimonas aurantiaca TaxID=3234185 RepID=UPI003467544F
MLNKVSLTIAIVFILGATAFAQSVDDYWNEVTRTVMEGDFEGYAALYHEDAVLVSESSGNSYPISQALEGWKQGFEDTRAGKMKASVEFRFSQRLHGESTAHDTGIFKYSALSNGTEWNTSYIRFQGLLVKKGGKWLMMMEYQMDQAGIEEWEALD